VHGVDAVEDQWLPVDIVGAAVIAERHLMGRALRDADGCAVEALQILHAGVLTDHKPLAVIEIDWSLAQAERYAPQIGLRGIAVEHVDLARLQGGKAILRGQRYVAHLVGITEDACSQGPAIIDVEPLEIALRIRCREAGESGAHAAYQRAAL